MENKKEELHFIDKYVAPAFIILIIVYAVISRHNNLEAIKKCHKIAVGKVIGYTSSRYNEGNDIEYYVDGKRYVKTNGFYVPLPKNKKIPIIYPCSNPNFGQVLLTPNDFAEFGLEFPDSMKWIFPYIEKLKEQSLIPIDP